MPYFDYNATAPLCPAARKAWTKANDNCWQNPSSPYGSAARAKIYLDQAREHLGALINCSPELLIFNSGATEGNNSIFAYFKKVYPASGKIIVSAVEHPSIIEAARYWFPERHELLPVEHTGIVDLKVLNTLLEKEDVVLVSVMAANNETGILQPWLEIAQHCQKKGIPFHCDASQWFGKLPSKGLGICDFLTGCAHKFGGPKGVGFIKISPDYSSFRTLVGGEQENGYRAGTEDYPGIASMLAAFETHRPQSVQQEQNWMQSRTHFENAIKEKIPNLTIVGHTVPRLWNTVPFIFPEYENLRWVRLLEKKGFNVSTGSACATGKEGPSHVMAAMGYPPEAMQRFVRVSGGWETQPEDWKALANAFGEVWKMLNAPKIGPAPGKSQVIDL